MKASISSKQFRSAGHILLFDIDEATFEKEVNRNVTKQTALDGTVITTNWAFAEGERLFVISNTVLSRTNYDILIAMKEDDDYDFLFNYVNSTWQVILQEINGKQIKNDKMLVTMTLSVVEKYNDGETS